MKRNNITRLARVTIRLILTFGNKYLFALCVNWENNRRKCCATCCLHHAEALIVIIFSQHVFRLNDVDERSNGQKRPKKRLIRNMKKKKMKDTSEWQFGWFQLNFEKKEACISVGYVNRWLRYRLLLPTSLELTGDCLWRCDGLLDICRWDGVEWVHNDERFSYTSTSCRFVFIFSLSLLFIFLLLSIYLFILFPSNDGVKRKMNTIWQFAVRTDFSAICMRVWLSTIDFQMAISRFLCEWKRTMGIILGARVFMCARVSVKIYRHIKYYEIDYYYYFHYMRCDSFIVYFVKAVDIFFLLCKIRFQIFSSFKFR